MGVDIATYRARIGCFHMPDKTRSALAVLVVRSRTVRLCFRLMTVLLCMMVLSCGDVEANPGPPRRNAAQRTISFSQQMASPSCDNQQRNSRGDEDSELMLFLRDMRSEVRNDLASINSKIDDISHTVNTLKTENEELRRSNLELKGDVSNLQSKLDKLEGNSRRNNLRFYGLCGEVGEDWGVSETKVRNFITNDLDLPELEQVGIERAHRVKGRDSKKCPIIVSFSRFKDRETIFKKARQMFGSTSQYSIQADYTERVKLHRRELGKRMLIERSAGRYAAISHDKLIIENDVYRYNQSTNDIALVGSARSQPAQRYRERQTTNSHDQPRDQNEAQSEMSVPSDSQRLDGDEASSGSV